MRPAADLFKAETGSFWDTVNNYSGVAGFRVPEYQRTYDWSRTQIKRLLEDCLNGFFELSKNQNYKYTFLGTIILVSEKKFEDSFDGRSLSIVDGQQRLTTLILICCALIEELLLHHDDVEYIKLNTAQWIKKEFEYVCYQLSSCVIGQLHGRGKTTFPFPRIVRIGKDYRARKKVDAEYSSTIAKFLMDFADFYDQEKPVFSPRRKEGKDAEEKRYFENYEYIKAEIHGIYEHEETSSDTSKKELEYEQVQSGSFEKEGLRNLFKKLDVLGESKYQNSAISDIAKNSNSSGLVRLLLFSHYLTQYVILTQVETNDEDSAFDIFDALNTTGEPLTALETFKPRIIRFENEKNSSYHGSNSEEYFERIEQYLNDIYPETEKRQKATKDLILTFALYLEGHKLSLHLAAQRSYLRDVFDGQNHPGKKRLIVKSIADIAEFRHKYWNSESISNLNDIGPVSDKTKDVLKLCCKFISDMKTSMALPVLARYWVEYKKCDIDINTFVNAVKAVTAFIILRRSVTGGTRGIDTDFRKIIKGNEQNVLCVGLDHANTLPSLDVLKTTLREYLENRRIGVKDKDSWVSRVREVDLAKHSNHLCRFLLFAASHNARPSQNRAGLLSAGKIPDEDINFLNFRRWCDDTYGTVEHVAPQSEPTKDSSWDPEIYQNQYTRNTVGNLVLLPQKENSTIGNHSWEKKKLFYSSLASDTYEDRRKLLSEAKKAGFSVKSEKLIEKRLYMLTPLIKVKKWNKEFIKNRTRNILELAWEEIAPWLSYE